jgi:hypothetical protein
MTSNSDPTALLLRKTESPKMLKELINVLDAQAPLPSAFGKCGLYPLNPQEVLNRIPSIVEDTRVALVWGPEQEEAQGPEDSGWSGQSYSAQDSEEEDDVEEFSEEKLEDEEPPEPHPGASSLKFGTSVVAIYEGQWFLADVFESQEKVGHGYTRLSYAAIKGTNCFAWTDKPDIMFTLNEDIILSEVNMVPFNNRGDVGLTKQDFKKVENWMIVVYIPFVLNISAQYSYFFRKRFSKLKLNFPQFLLLLFTFFYC